MKKIKRIGLLLPLLVSCNISANNTKYVEKDKFYQVFYYQNKIEYDDNVYIYFDNGTIHDIYYSSHTSFKFKTDDNDFIYNYETHKIWGKIYSDGLIFAYNTTYDLDFTVTRIFGNSSYLKMIETSI